MRKSEYSYPRYSPQMPDGRHEDIECLSDRKMNMDNMDNPEWVVKLVMFLLFVAMAAGVFYGSMSWDESNRNECIESGGTVVEVYGARPVGFTQPWICDR